MKKILFALAAVLTISASVYCYTQKSSTSAMNELAMANIEALASGESGGTSCARYYLGAYCGYFIDVTGKGTKVYYPYS